MEDVSEVVHYQVERVWMEDELDIVCYQFWKIL